MLNFHAENKQENKFRAILAFGMHRNFHLQVRKKQLSKKLKKIHLNVSATNKRAIHLYKKAGFTTEGILQRESYVNGRYRDEYRMAHFL